MAISRDEVFERVKEVLIDALGVDDDEVLEGATLMGDLGAESIDFLDIVFRLEKTFSIKIPRGELSPPDDLQNNPEYVESGKLTEKGLQRLKDAMPHARDEDMKKFEEDPDIAKMPDLFSVGMIVNYVTKKAAA